MSRWFCLTLEALSRKRTASQALAERARVLLACADEDGVAPLTHFVCEVGIIPFSCLTRADQYA